MELRRNGVEAIEELIDFLVDLGVSEIGISYMEGGAIKSEANSARKVTPEELARNKRPCAAEG